MTGVTHEVAIKRAAHDELKKQYQQYLTNCRSQTPPERELTFDGFVMWQNYVRIDVV